MIIDPSKLSEDALVGVLESVICREGTDYGELELSHKSKLENLELLVKAGKVLLVFDQASNEINLVSKDEYHQLGATNG